MEAYVSQFALHDVDEGWVNVDTVQRIRFAEEGNHVVLDLPGCEDRHIDGLRMGLGVPADQNLDVDPAGYPADHPLGFRRLGRHALGLGCGVHLQRVRRSVARGS